MTRDTRQDAWDARKNERQRLTMLQRQRRLVYGTYGEDDGAERAQELEYLILKCEQQIEEYLSQCPAGRLGHADEIALFAVFLASDAARFITGAKVAVDGGV